MVEGLNVFSKRTGVGVSLAAALDFALVGLAVLVRSPVLEPIAGVAVGFRTSGKKATVRFFEGVRSVWTKNVNFLESFF